MERRYAWVCSVVLYVVTACGGDGATSTTEPTQLHGVVQSSLSRQPVPDVTVELWESVWGTEDPFAPQRRTRTNAVGEFALVCWQCIGYLEATHPDYDIERVSLGYRTPADIVIKLTPLPRSVAIVPAAAVVTLGGTQALVSDVLYRDGTRAPSDGSWSVAGGSECGSLTPEQGPQTIYTTPPTIPSAGCDTALPGHVRIDYSYRSRDWATAHADLTLAAVSAFPRAESASGNAAR